MHESFQFSLGHILFFKIWVPSAQALNNRFNLRFNLWEEKDSLENLTEDVERSPLQNAFICIVFRMNKIHFREFKVLLNSVPSPTRDPKSLCQECVRGENYTALTFPELDTVFLQMRTDGAGEKRAGPTDVRRRPAFVPGRGLGTALSSSYGTGTKPKESLCRTGMRLCKKQRAT